MFILSLEDHPTHGFVVQYKEEGISNPTFELYTSTSFTMAAQYYRKARNSIDAQCFKLIEEKDKQNNPYCKFKPILYYVDKRGLGAIK